MSCLFGPAGDKRRREDDTALHPAAKAGHITHEAHGHETMQAHFRSAFESGNRAELMRLLSNYSPPMFYGLFRPNAHRRLYLSDNLVSGDSLDAILEKLRILILLHQSGFPYSPDEAAHVGQLLRDFHRRLLAHAHSSQGLESSAFDSFVQLAQTIVMLPPR